MTRVALFADVHIGNHVRMGGPRVAGINTRCGELVTTLTEACCRAAAAAPVLVIAGDLFESARPVPQIVAATMRALVEGPSRIIIVAGNHDVVSATPGDNALGPLTALRDVTVVDIPCIDSELVLVPWRPGPAAEWLPAAVDALDPKPGSVLVTHIGIADDSTPPWLRDTDEAVHADAVAELAVRHGIDAVFAGHWHHAQHFDRRGVVIRQLGSLAATGFGDLCGVGWATLWVNGRCATASMPGPRFAKYGVTETPPETPPDGAAPFRSQWSVLRQRYERCVDVARRLSYECDVVCVADDAAVVAVAAATGAESVDAAVVAYVEALQLPDGVSRDTVLGLVRRYLDERS